jgi:hypothetical protein
LQVHGEVVGIEPSKRLRQGNAENLRNPDGATTTLGATGCSSVVVEYEAAEAVSFDAARDEFGADVGRIVRGTNVGCPTFSLCDGFPAKVVPCFLECQLMGALLRKRIYPERERRVNLSAG